MVAWCHGSSLLFGFPLSPCTQWGWQTVAGQHLTGWGLPSLRRAIAVQWYPRISPTVGSNPWRHGLRQSMAYNRYLLLHVLCPRGWRSWSVLSRCESRCRWLNGCKPGQCYVGDPGQCYVGDPGQCYVGDPGQCYVGDRLLPMQHAPSPPLSTSVMDPKEQQGHYSLAPVTSQELPKWGLVQRQTVLGTPTPDFS